MICEIYCHFSRILSQFNYDTEKEIRYMELLKLRFGEAQLHYCEVMLKDVADSKRINSLIHNGELQGHQPMVHWHFSPEAVIYDYKLSLLFLLW